MLFVLSAGIHIMTCATFLAYTMKDLQNVNKCCSVLFCSVLFYNVSADYS
jgi:hypothetical protein